MEKPKFIVEGEKIIEIVYEGLRIPCNAPREKIDDIERLLRELRKLGVFERGEREYRDFLESLTNREKRIIKLLPTDDWISKEKLDREIGTKERETAGVLANLTRKAREHHVIGKGEYLIEKKWERGTLFYRLRKEFEKLKNMINMLS